ncbi:MAG: S-formylglutathione hydrolase [Archangium gephyra]|uniref:S-formylglutathione hydrolase n=1 Tax=Archangium gephyra TaxID=48 RepID=A0A2W5TBT1_9BACT|nr:MAG: S-formylglutathione hydrolase [Archangium gephyra]
MERLEQHANFGGRQEVWKHASSTLKCEMKFGVYLPPAALRGEQCPVLYWLSGLANTEQNFITKSGAQQFAAQLGLILVNPDTSPRGADVPDQDGYDIGQGAGFYLNATTERWAPHFKMETYVVSELPQLIEQNFPVTSKRGISGHSMGGHGALTLALRHPGKFASVSAFAPIVTPSQVPWGVKAFTAYLGEDREAWKAHDATELISTAREQLPLLVDQGEGDEFLGVQLKPELFEAACAKAKHPLTLRRHADYDHGYYFVASFIADHLAHHAKALR